MCFSSLVFISNSVSEKSKKSIVSKAAIHSVSNSALLDSTYRKQIRLLRRLKKGDGSKLEHDTPALDPIARRNLEPLLIKIKPEKLSFLILRISV